MFGFVQRIKDRLRERRVNKNKQKIDSYIAERQSRNAADEFTTTQLFNALGIYDDETAVSKHNTALNLHLQEHQKKGNLTSVYRVVASGDLRTLAEYDDIMEVPNCVYDVEKGENIEVDPARTLKQIYKINPSP